MLTSLLQVCTPSELLFLSQTIAPLLKRDFLFSLPPELGLHILGFIDDPKSLIRASLVSKWWYKMVRDESVWRRMCIVYGFGEGDEEGEREKHKHHRHHNQKYSRANLKGTDKERRAEIGEQPFSALLREDAGANSDGREGLSGMSSPPTESSSTRFPPKKFSYRRHFKISYIIRTSLLLLFIYFPSPFPLNDNVVINKYYPLGHNWRHGGKLLNSQIITPNVPTSRAPVVPSETNPEDALPSTVTSFALDKSWFVVGLTNSSIKVFSAHSGVLARTLVGHEGGVWGVCLVAKGGSKEGRDFTEEGEDAENSNERKEFKEKKDKKRKQKERQEKEDGSGTPKPTKDSATVAIVADPESKIQKGRKATNKGKDINGERDGDKGEQRSRRTAPKELPLVGHIRVEANDRFSGDQARGSPSSSNREGRPCSSPSVATTLAPASAGRRTSTSPKKPRNHPSATLSTPQGPQDQVNSELEGLSILRPVESGLGGATFPILSAEASSTPATLVADELGEVHSRSRSDIHHHHHHHRRSRRNSTVNLNAQRGTTSSARNMDNVNRHNDHVDSNPHQKPTKFKGGDGMHVMPGESLAHLLPVALRVALGLPQVAEAETSSGSEGTSESEDDDGQARRHRRRRRNHHHEGEVDTAEDFQGELGERKPLEYEGQMTGANMTNASRGWGQPNALVLSGGCDKVLRVWEVKSG